MELCPQAGTAATRVLHASIATRQVMFARPISLLRSALAILVSRVTFREEAKSAAQPSVPPMGGPKHLTSVVAITATRDQMVSAIHGGMTTAVWESRLSWKVASLRLHMELCPQAGTAATRVLHASIATRQAMFARRPRKETNRTQNDCYMTLCDTCKKNTNISSFKSGEMKDEHNLISRCSLSTKCA